MSKILVIEDEAAIRRVLKKILTEESKDYLVEEAEDGLAGMEKIKEEDYDLVLCDIKMPKMDGIEVLEATKKIKPETPFVMISGHDHLAAIASHHFCNLLITCRDNHVVNVVCKQSTPPDMLNHWNAKKWKQYFPRKPD